jgi:hypothetical protein
VLAPCWSYLEPCLVQRLKGKAIHFGGPDWPVVEELQHSCPEPSWALFKVDHVSFDLKDMHFILGATTDQLVKSCKAIAFCHLEPFQGGSIFYSIYYTLDSTPYSISTLVCSALLYSTLFSSIFFSRFYSIFHSTLLCSSTLLDSTQPTGIKTFELLLYFRTSGSANWT